MKEIMTNKHGLQFEIYKIFVKYDDAGNQINEYVIDGYNFAKMVLYKDATKLLSPEDEKKAIEKILKSKNFAL